jgi:V8-like Glu-specific endopeptidase
MRSTIAAVLVFSWAVAPASAQELKPGVPVEGKLVVGEGEEPVTKVFTFTVPETAVAAEVTLESDIPVAIVVSEEPGTEEETVPEPDRIQRVRMIRGGEWDLFPGKWFVNLTLYLEELDAYGGGELEAVPFTLSLKFFHRRVDGKIRADGTLALSIDSSRGPFRTFELELKEDAKHLRFDLICSSADLAMWVFEGSPGDLGEEPLGESRFSGGIDTLVVEGGEGVARGKYFLTVADPYWNDWKSPFRLGCSTTGKVTKGLFTLPRIPTGKTPLEKAIHATVSVICESGGGGSGVFISEKGFLLTNYHVVQFDMEGRKKIWVAPTTDVRVAPVEGFLVEVVEVDRRRDLALLKCVSGAFGEPIPPDYRFPAMALSRKDRVKIGDPLTVLGYPSVGGSVGRLTLTLCRGVVSGFEPHGKELMVKTDADINGGNSGGPVVDRDHSLVGLATETVGNDDGGPGQMGYLRPVWIVPAEWWKKAGIK